MLKQRLLSKAHHSALDNNNETQGPNQAHHIAAPIYAFLLFNNYISLKNLNTCSDRIFSKHAASRAFRNRTLTTQRHSQDAINIILKRIK
jgi:hypothetical protein